MSKTATREAYGKALAQLVTKRKDVIVLDADLTKSTKTIDALQAKPSQHFNMGIAEGNMMGVAAGLASSGKVVYASSFAMFAAGRAYEQIRNSIAYPKRNVKICATHAGISVGEDGASHQCIEDLALMRVIPDMKVYQPCDANSTKAIIEAIADIEGPCYVRLGRCAVEDVYPEGYTFTSGKGTVLRKGKRIALIASGLMVQEALQAAEMLSEEVTVIDMASIKPIDAELIKEVAKNHEIIYTLEEHNVIGGLGSAVAEVLAPTGIPCPIHMIGIQDRFGESGTPQELLKAYGLDAEHVYQIIETDKEKPDK